ncbi:MAG: hypothetical protein LC722_07710 [Actinobacteria bacterium]|nr:hypothetical protein [Actinomycetota bacterium]
MMQGNGYTIAVYGVYLAVAVGLTAWLARTLFKSGVAFLHDVFKDSPALPDAVNRLLVVGFYMLNLGYAMWVLRAGRGLDAFAAVQFLVNRLAILLVTLAALHFVNVFVFWRIRLHTEERQLPPPMVPQYLLPEPARPKR